MVAPYPNAVELLYIPAFESVNAPKYVLLIPVVFLLPAPLPIATVFPVEVVYVATPFPINTLLYPVVMDVAIAFPIPIFWKPVCNAGNTLLPIPMIPYPVGSLPLIIVLPIAMESRNWVDTVLKLPFPILIKLGPVAVVLKLGNVPAADDTLIL